MLTSMVKSFNKLIRSLYYRVKILLNFVDLTSLKENLLTPLFNKIKHALLMAKFLFLFKNI